MSSARTAIAVGLMGVGALSLAGGLYITFGTYLSDDPIWTYAYGAIGTGIAELGAGAILFLRRRG